MKSNWSSLTLVLSLIVLSSCSRSKKQISDDAYLEKKGDKFTFIYDGEGTEKWTYLDVDSIASDSGAFLILGRKTEKDEKKWFAIGIPSPEAMKVKSDKASGFKETGIYGKKKSAKQVWEE